MVYIKMNSGDKIILSKKKHLTVMGFIDYLNKTNPHVDLVKIFGQYDQELHIMKSNISIIGEE